MTGNIVQLFPSTFNDDATGYGFIQTDDGERVYFNASGVQMSSIPFSSMKVGDRAQRFTIIDHPKGPRAIEVFVADPHQQGLPL